MAKLRWFRSSLHKAKHPVYVGTGLHPHRYHPLRKIGEFFADLDELGRKHALHLAKIAGTLPKFELRKRVEKLIERCKTK